MGLEVTGRENLRRTGEKMVGRVGIGEGREREQEAEGLEEQEAHRSANAASLKISHRVPSHICGS